MIEILVNNTVVAICAPELVSLFVSALIPNIGLEYKVETHKHTEASAEAQAVNK